MRKKGLYLYAIQQARQKGAFPKMKGIDKMGVVFLLRIGEGMEAIVSRVPLDEFGSEEMSERAQNDLTWIKEKSFLHNEVIRKSGECFDEPVIPMKFGSIFYDEKSLEKSVKKNSKKFVRLFEKLRGREEWSVKVFADEEKVRRKVVENSSLLRKKSKKIASLSPGIAYFKEKELEGEVESRKDEELAKLADKIHKSIPPYVDEVKFGKILANELTMRSEPMILNVALFIRKENKDTFLTDMSNLRDAVKEKGLIVEVSGPWPPYSFV